MVSDAYMINEKDNISTLDRLIYNWENEVVEFKEANNDYNKNKIGQYFSALSNEANLNNLQCGWLVFGVRNRDRKIVGTDYRDTQGLERLKQEISDNTTGGLSFIEIYEVYPKVDGEQKRVIMFQIPAAATGIPTGWNNHYYGRNGESLSALSIVEQDKIRSQEKRDWSKQIVKGATIEHLDKEAISLAREKYKEKMKKPHIIEAVDAMSDEEFLIKTKLIINGQITNAALLLLGNEDYDNYFESTPEASWRLYDSKGNIKDYEILKIPYITLSDRLFSKIRNLTYRYMPNQLTLFPTETMQYDSWTLHELINNSIAHSDYTIGGRIYLNELEDEIVLTNPGSFIPGDIEATLKLNYTAPFYRNQLLSETMVKFNMIDTQSMGIRKVFKIQQEKFFPLPDYDFSVPQQVGVTVYGKILDENYTKVLFKNQDFDLETVFLIDRVQKNKPIDKEAIKHLRKLGVIEGRAPGLYISAQVAESMDQKAQYVKNKAFDDEYYRMLILQYLSQFGKASKKEIRDLVKDKLPDVLDDKQKENKLRNLLYDMSKKGLIVRDSDNFKDSRWQLPE
jgi:ATP-dependent DNA helicase RecG